jgi:hypothetical protein
MIVPLNIVVCSLKSVKRLFGVQNDSPVFNTLRRLDSPMLNTPGSLHSPVMNTPGSQLLGVFGTSIRTVVQQKFMVTNRPGSQDSSIY